MTWMRVELYLEDVLSLGMIRRGGVSIVGHRFSENALRRGSTSRALHRTADVRSRHSHLRCRGAGARWLRRPDSAVGVTHSSGALRRDLETMRAVHRHAPRNRRYDQLVTPTAVCRVWSTHQAKSDH